MKTSAILAATALLALASFSNASAQIVNFYGGFTATNQTLTYSTPFTETYFSPSFLNSVLSATLTAKKAGEIADADVTADVFLQDGVNPPVQVGTETLTLSLSTTTSTTQTIETTDYPVTFYAGPTGTFDNLIVEVTGSDLTNALVSFTGLAELESIPEPSTWAMLLGGVGVLIMAARFRRVARQA